MLVGLVVFVSEVGLSRDIPVLEDPSTYTYYREEVGGWVGAPQIGLQRQKLLHTDQL